MSNLTTFKAVYCSGLFIPEASAVSALSLLFEKIYLPNNVEFVIEFSKRYRIWEPPAIKKRIASLHIEGVDTDVDPFDGLTPAQRDTAKKYLIWGRDFSLNFAPLFPEVFETGMFSKNSPLEVTLKEKGPPGGKNKYNVKVAPMTLVGEDYQTIPKLISQNYIPVVGSFNSSKIYSKQIDEFSAQQLATFLAMKSIEMLIPRTKAVHPEIILEARHRLSNQLPPFWSSMFKLSVELRHRIKQGGSNKDIFSESQDLIDTIVRPSLIDLQEKMLKGKRDWFYKILAPIQTGLKLFIGNPPITQQQLLTNALLLGLDVTSSAIENMRTIDALKREAGLTFLLEADKALNKPKKNA